MTKKTRKPAGRACIIPNDRTFRKMWDDNTPTSEIAHFYGCNRHVVNASGRRYGYPQRGPERPRGAKVEVSAAQATKPPLDPLVKDAKAEMVDRLIATKGRWDGLNMLRDEMEWSSAYVQQQYHKAASSRPIVTKRI